MTRKHFKKYTVVAIWVDSGDRVASHVNAVNPETAEREFLAGNDAGEDLLIAGIFEGHLIAVDEGD